MRGPGVFYTDKQLAIIEFIQRFRRMRGKSPTLGEMAEHFRVSKVTVHDHLRQLEAKGAVRKAPHRARALEILDPDYIDRAQPPPEEGRLPVKLLGTIAAGRPINAVENPEEIDLATLLPMGREHYALRVAGDSMIDEGIHDGDLVIVERRSSADDGELVVAIIGDEEATLKKLFRETRDGRPIFRLQPANERLEPIYVDELQIRGVVVSVVRRYGGMR